MAKVKLDTQAQQVDVYVEHPERTQSSCPECGKQCAVYDHTPSRGWRHLVTMQFRTILDARPFRIHCPEQGGKKALLPWAEKSSRFTILFERFAIDVL